MSRLLFALIAATALTVAGCRSNAPREEAPAQSTATSTQSKTQGEESGKATVGEDGRPHRYAKSIDGSFEGEIWGTPAKNSKFAQLRIGMDRGDIEKKIGQGSDVRTYMTGKAWIPFYHGTDGHRIEVFYKGQGSLIYTGGNAFGGGRGVLVGINHDANVGR
ncbi:MAG: hypothetical protein LBB76_00755 [Azoarcus sp.]|jgi:hypothetical protein|nr:hypothetical protein [Azoarcus sp.]